MAQTDSHPSGVEVFPSSRLAAIRRLLDSGRSFALYRLPKAGEVRLILQVDGEARTVSDEEADGDGFLFAPFKATEATPVLLIRPDVEAEGWEAIEQAACRQGKGGRGALSLETSTDDEDAEHSVRYADDFAFFHQALLEGRFKKLVLSHCLGVPNEMSARLGFYGCEGEVFLRALEAYPDAMVSMVYTPMSGCWIGATPELLLERVGDAFRTVALAGTKRIGEEWDEKNRQEQNIVVRYLQETLQSMGFSTPPIGPQTIRIGQLEHLMTEFCFQAISPVSTFQMARQLHPTPAVCGYPKEEAYCFILANEHCSRDYYSGYLGPVFGNREAHLFVNLRCAHIDSLSTYYYAGGGLTALSRLEDERQEIDQKMQILCSLRRRC